MSIYLSIAIYLVIMLVLGWLAYRKSSGTPEDYFLANRGLGILIIFFTFIATNFSAFFFIGFSGEGYRTGYSYYAMISFGTAFIATSFFFIGYKVWLLSGKFNYITPAEFVGDVSGDKWLKNVYLAIMVFFTLPYLALQPIGAGYLLEVLTGGEIQYFVGAAVLTAVIVVYVFMGGMRSVAITDVAQGIIMFIVIGLALWMIADDMGGIAEANRQAYEIRPDLFSPQGANNFFTRRKWFSLMVLWTLSVPMFPHMFTRFFIAKSAKTLKVSTVLYASVPCFLFIIPVMIGVLGHISFPGLEGKGADQILPMMLNKHAPAWVASLVMIGALAAFMSTLDSQLLALSTLLTRDVYMSIWKPKANYKTQVLVGKLMVVLCALAGLLIAYRPPDTLFSIATQTFTGYAVLFPVTLAILYLKNVYFTACTLAMVAGVLLIILFYSGVLPETYLFGFEPVVPVITVVTLIILGGTLMKNMFLKLSIFSSKTKVHG